MTFDENLPVASDTPDDLIAIDEALRSLAAQYERKSQVVELRFFGGLSVEETAEVLKISPETVMRDWKFAKHWLMRELSRSKHAMMGLTDAQTWISEPCTMPRWRVRPGSAARS